MIQVTNKAQRALNKVLEDKPDASLRVYVTGFG